MLVWHNNYDARGKYFSVEYYEPALKDPKKDPTPENIVPNAYTRNNSKGYGIVQNVLLLRHCGFGMPHKTVGRSGTIDSLPEHGLAAIEALLDEAK